MGEGRWGRVGRAGGGVAAAGARAQPSRRRALPSHKGLVIRKACSRTSAIVAARRAALQDSQADKEADGQLSERVEKLVEVRPRAAVAGKTAQPGPADLKTSAGMEDDVVKPRLGGKGGKDTRWRRHARGGRADDAHACLLSAAARPGAGGGQEQGRGRSECRGLHMRGLGRVKMAARASAACGCAVQCGEHAARRRPQRNPRERSLRVCAAVVAGCRTSAAGRLRLSGDDVQVGTAGVAARR
jgi:hypothetical protein